VLRSLCVRVSMHVRLVLCACMHVGVIVCACLCACVLHACVRAWGIAPSSYLNKAKATMRQVCDLCVPSRLTQRVRISRGLHATHGCCLLPPAAQPPRSVCRLACALFCAAGVARSSNPLWSQAWAVR
jgi:hypothetical protein